MSDPAVTRHLAAFLSTTDAQPDAILFNGGFFIPDICRDRVVDVMERWYGKRPLVFENRDLDLAVSVGAAYYSYVRSTGAGLLVRGGLPRAYYIGIGTSGDKVRTVCLAPRGTEEGSALEIDREDLQLVAKKPCRSGCTARSCERRTSSARSSSSIATIPICICTRRCRP